MGELRYIDQTDDGPLCPNFEHPQHQLAVKVQNADCHDWTQPR